jgi:hypothetical protein
MAVCYFEDDDQEEFRVQHGSFIRSDESRTFGPSGEVIELEPTTNG